MILIIGTDEDPTILKFCAFLKEKCTPFLLFDQKYLLNGNNISSSSISIMGHKYSYDSFSGVLNRLSSPSDHQHLPFRYSEAVMHLFCILSTKLNNVFNESYLGISNDSKLYQLGLLNLQHIKKPNHVVLCKHSVKKNLTFKAVVKSLSSIRSEVIDYHSNQKKYFSNQSYEPVLFQELITGENIRVHVVVDECFAIKINATTLDYRYGSNGLEFKNYKLSIEIYDECINIARQLNLKFCGIDLIKLEGKFYILEVNPSPGWFYFEEKIKSDRVSSKLLSELRGRH